MEDSVDLTRYVRGSAEVPRLLLNGEADGETRLAGVNADPGEQVAVIVSAVARLADCQSLAPPNRQKL